MATLEIPKDVLDPIINAHVTKALTEVFGNGGLVLQEVVKRVLTAKVDSRGEPDRHGSRDAKPLVEHLVLRALEDAAKAAVVEALSAHKDVLKNAIVRELKRSNSRMLKNLAESLVEVAGKAAGHGYRMTIQIIEQPV